MKLIDLTKGKITSINRAYLKILQPMPIYYSKENLLARERTEAGDSPSIVTGQQFYEQLNLMLSANKTLKAYTVVYLKSPIFIATGEKFKMLDLDIATGERRPDVDSPVENNYIRVFAVENRMNSIFHVYTSSGVWAAGNKGVTFTGAVAPVFKNEIQWNKQRKSEYKMKITLKKLEKLKTGKVEQIEDYKFIGWFLNDKSPTYLNMFTSAHMAYSSSVNGLQMTDVNEILSSDRIRNLIISQMRIFMPTLAEEVKKLNKPLEIAQYLKQIAEDTVNSETASVDDKLKSVQAIVNIGYQEEALYLDHSIESKTLPAASSRGQNLITESPKESIGYEDEDLDKDEITDLTSEKAFNAAAKEVDLVEEYVQDIEKKDGEIVFTKPKPDDFQV